MLKLQVTQEVYHAKLKRVNEIQDEDDVRVLRRSLIQTYEESHDDHYRERLHGAILTDLATCDQIWYTNFTRHY